MDTRLMSTENKAGKDFHLAVGDTDAIEAGAYVGGVNGYYFGYNIDGVDFDTLNDHWNIGAD